MWQRSLALFLGLAVAALWVAPSGADDLPFSTVPFAERERFGAGGSAYLCDVDQEYLNWYSGWHVWEAPARPSLIEHGQVVKVGNPFTQEDLVYIAAAAASNPGSWWFVGSEPDHGFVGVQDHCSPSDYAIRYRQAYVAIKTSDPTAKVAAGGVVQASPVRLRYLDAFLAEYEALYGGPVPADGWHFHEQILNEVQVWGCGIPLGVEAYADEGKDYGVDDNVSVVIFQNHVEAMRGWMAINGYRELPLILSEFGVYQPSGCGYLGGDDKQLGDEMVLNFLRGTHEFLESATDAATGMPSDGNRLVQRWSWYSLTGRPMDPVLCTEDPDPMEGNGALFRWDDPSQLTIFGEAYLEMMKERFPTAMDLDGDRRMDLVVWRPSNATWYGALSSKEYSGASADIFKKPWGLGADQPIRGDLDGDGLMDLILWRPSNATWYGALSTTNWNTSTGTFALGWGLAGDKPISGDLDGDGIMDLIVWRPSNATWYGALSSTGYNRSTNYVALRWGLSSDIPLSGDLDGDGKTDLIVWRPSNATWYAALSSTGYNRSTNYLALRWGLSSDVPMSTDFDADGRMDLAVFRPSDQTWYVALSGHGYSTSSRVLVAPGVGSGDVPVSGSSDLGNRTDLISWSNSDANWRVAFSSKDWSNTAGFVQRHGSAGDKVPATH